MKARYILCFLLLFVVTTAFAVMEVRLDSETQLQLHYELDKYTIEEFNNYSRLNVENVSWDSPIGTPELPFYEFKVAVPQNGNIDVKMQILEIESESLNLPLMPVPSIIKGKEVSEYNYSQASSYEIYRGDIRIEKGEYTEYRTSAFFPVRIYPVSYKADKGRLDIGTKFDITINISGNVRAKRNHSSKEAKLISHLFVNLNTAKEWKVNREESQINFIDWSLSNHWYKFKTNQQGIMSITASDLSALPLDDIDPRTIRILSTGGKLLSYNVEEKGDPLEEIPILIEGEADGSFDSSDKIILYVESRDLRKKNLAIGQSYYKNPYSAETVYWLTFGGNFSEPPKRLSYLPSYDSEDVERTITQYPFVVRRESERYRRTQMGFEWYDYLMSGSSTASYSFNIDLQDVAETQSSYKRFEMSVRETASEQYGNGHHLNLEVNNKIIANTSWTGQSARFISSSDYNPINGANSILIEVVRSRSDDILLDYMQMTYDKLFMKRSNKQYMISIMDFDENQITDFQFTKDNSNDVYVMQVDDFNKTWLVPHSSNGTSFNFIADCNIVNSSYTQPTNYFIAQNSDFISPNAIEAYYPEDYSLSVAIDYLIITPQEFIEQANDLAQIYQSERNLNCKVASLDRILDQFNGGMDDPGAIRLYIYHLAEVNPNAENMAVVLLGSGTYDWRNNSGNAGSKNKMMVYQEESIASDDYFVMLRQNARPEVPIGRIPAQTVEQLNLQIDRIENWNKTINPGWWRNTALLLADDDRNGSATGEYYHSAQIQAASETLDRSIITKKIFAIDYEMDEYQNKPEVRDKFVQSINDGTLIWYYVGHGSYDKLGTEDYFNAITDISKLNNNDKLNLFIAASCDVGEFDSYNFDSLGEQLLFANNGGAIATISATRECYGTQNTELIKHFLRYNCNERLSLGESLMLAKDDSPYATNDKKYVLLGDPMLYLVPPPRDTETVLVDKEDTVINSREKISIKGKFLNNVSDGYAEFRAIDNDKVSELPNLQSYSVNGLPFYNGEVSVKNGEYNATFIVPDDIREGDLGRTIAYYYDNVKQQDYVSVLSPISYDDSHIQVIDVTAPEVSIWLDDKSFVSGDIVSNEPLFHATINDESGVNTLGSPGHKILLDMDDNEALYDLTDYFVYDIDSYKQGTLEMVLSNLEPGRHKATLVVFDNYNNPSIKAIDFVTTDTVGYSILDFLPYPNPMPKSGGYLTFRVNELSDYSIKIYTISGKKIKTLKGSGSGYIQIPWNGRDDRGSKIANNTYFLKLKTKSKETGKSLEKTQKLVIFDK